MAKKNKNEGRGESVPDVLHVRVAEDIKKAYEKLAKTRTQPNRKSVTVADVAREALAEYLDKQAA